MRIIQELLIAHGFPHAGVLYPELMPPDSRNARIRRVLLKGPCTTDEVAALLGINPESAHRGLWTLSDQGHIERLHRVRLPAGWRTLYGLTRHGAALAKRHHPVRSIGEPKAAAGPPPHDGGSPCEPGNAFVWHNPPGPANAVHLGTQAPAQT